MLVSIETSADDFIMLYYKSIDRSIGLAIGN